MFSAITRLFQRYCDQHYAIYVPGFPVLGADGNKIGHLDRLCFGRGVVRAEGWTTAKSLAVGNAGALNWVKPDIVRKDVNNAQGFANDCKAGFNIVGHGVDQTLVLAFRSADFELRIANLGVGRLRKWKADFHIRFSFCRDMLYAAPRLLRALMRTTTANKQSVKRALRLSIEANQQVLRPEVFAAASAIRAHRPITIVMPVFNAFEVLQEALRRVACNTNIDWRMVLVEDCSTDPRIRPLLSAWAREQCSAGHDVQVLENERNLGFIGSVNRGLKQAMVYGDHVVLLNSDALVPEGWVNRLLHPIWRDSKVASVTPLSNDAEIFVVPHMCKRYDIAPLMAERIDAALAQFVSADAYQVAPTGVGFCMAMNLRYLRKIPELDSAFGKGYGEEVDWCQKAHALGGKNVCQSNVFVEHRGGQSFGSEEKKRAIARNNALVSRRYPKFDQSVQHFMASDCLRSARIIGAVSMLSEQCDPVPIYIAHSMGGGAELYLQDQVKEALDAGLGAIILRVGGPHSWRIEIAVQGGWVHVDTDDFALLKKALAPVRKRSIIYSCAVGSNDPLSVLSAIKDLLNQDSNLSILVHDYFMISPSYCLLDNTGNFVGIPDIDTKDAAHQFSSTKGTLITHKEWREKWLGLLTLATEIRCFSQSSAALLTQAYPSVQTTVKIVPHSVFDVPLVSKSQKNKSTKIGVLGDIGMQKGAGIVQTLARNFSGTCLDEMIVVGRIDPRFRLSANVHETGAYQRQDIATLAEHHEIACWLIPSIWPETFSYTTHEALATGLPVFCFHIGAQKDAVAAAQNGHVLPFEWRRNPTRILSRITEVLQNGTTGQRLYCDLEGRRNRGFAA